MHTLHIEYPDEILYSTKENEASFNQLAKEAMVIKLYELGKLSSGLGAKMMNITRAAFLELLGKYNIGIYDFMSEDDLIKDMESIDE